MFHLPLFRFAVPAVLLYAGTALAASSVELSADQAKILGLVETPALPAASVPLDHLPAEIRAPLETSRTLSAPFAGVVLSVSADDGAELAAGAPLAQIQSRDFLEAQTRLRQAENEARLARRVRDRDARLLDEGIIAASRAEESRARAVDAELRLAQARAALGPAVAVDGAAGVYALRAPVAARVLRRELTPGDRIDAFEPAFMLDTGEGVDVLFQVPVAFHASLAPGLPVWMDDGTRGEVVAVGATADGDSQSLRLRARLPARSPWVVGQRTALRLDLPAPADALRVPLAALLPDGERTLLFVARQGRYTAVEVERLGTSGDEAVVRGAFAAGDMVIARGASALKPLLSE